MKVVEREVSLKYSFPNQTEVKSYTSNRFYLLDDLIDIKNRKGFIIYPFSTLSNSIYFIDENDLGETDRVKTYFNNLGVQESTSEAEYFNASDELIKDLNHTDFGLSKVVQSRVINVQTQINPEILFNAASKKYPSTFRYFFSIQDDESWFGATPEILLNENSEEMEWVGLAGTKKKPDVWTEKEKEEHRAVTRYIKDLITKYHLQILQSEEEFTIDAGPIQHLKSVFTTNKTSNDLDLIHDLHPTPATCGFPKLKAMEYILNMEKHDRRFYCGFLGEWNMNNSKNLYVNLRSMEVFKDYVNIFVGGGITKDSDTNKEWIETSNKAQTLLDII